MDEGLRGFPGVAKEIADWLTAANTIQQKLAPVDGPYRAFFVGKLGSLKAIQPAILDAIAKIASAKNRIATTNYDHLISQALNWDRADWTNHLRVIEALQHKRPAVWHIHGDFDRPSSIIFSQDDYDRIAASELPQFVQKSAGLDFMLVFVGCSGSGLSDDNVGRLLNGCTRASPASATNISFSSRTTIPTSWPAGVTPVRFGDYADLSAYLARLAPEPVMPSRLPPNPRMIGREDRLEELVKAILDYDRPIVVPGALGMGKTTLALAAADDPRVGARFGKERRFFVNLEPAPDAAGVLSRIAIQLGLPATGAAHELEAKIAAACAAEPTLAILDNLEMLWRKDIAATETLLGELAAIEGLRLVITVRGEPPGIGARTLRNVEQLEDADARALFLRHAGDHFAADPALPGLLKALDGHPLSIELLAVNAQGKADLKGLAADWNDRRADLLRRGAANARNNDLPRFARSFARPARSAEPRPSPDPADGALAGRHVGGRQPHDPERRRADKRGARRGGPARNCPPRKPRKRPLAPARADPRDAARRLAAGGGRPGADGEPLWAPGGVRRARREGTNGKKCARS